METSVSVDANPQAYPREEPKYSTGHENATSFGLRPNDAPPVYEANVHQPQHMNPHMIPYTQQQTGQTIVLVQPPAVTSTNINTWLVVSIFSCICCFPPTGILAIVMSCLADSSLTDGDYEQARRYSTWAKHLGIASIVCGVTLLMIIIISSAAQG